MPELPELEIIRESLTTRVIGRTIESACEIRPGVLQTVAPPVGDLAGQRIRSVSRRGKHLVLTVRDDLFLVIHLMRGGRLILCRSGTKATKATGFIVRFADGEDLRLVENGSIKQAKIHVVRCPDDVAWIAAAGPEPLSDGFTVAYLKSACVGTRRQVKKLITDQTVVVGIGTAFADEILFEARLSPIRYVSTLDDDEIGRLHASIRTILSDAVAQIRVRAGGVVLDGHRRDIMKIYKKTGQPCPRCGNRIAEIRYAQTRTYYCPVCQASGKPIRDRRAWLTR